MQQPLWKKALSYLTGVHLETVDSAYNNFLKVVLKNGRYQLLTANAIYSYGDLYDNFTRAFRQMRLDEWPVKNVLILGFGLGSIPYMLERIFNQKYHYTAVEIDPSVLQLANRYVMSDIQSPVELHLGDAFTYVHDCRERFDMVCVDVFVDDEVPTEFENAHFLRALENVLSPQGVVLFNKLALSKKDKQQAMNFFNHQFKTVFTEGVVLDVEGNYILLNRSDVLKK